MAKKHHGIETLKSRYGLMFISPWILGMVIFFLLPIFQSVYYTLADISIDADGAHTSFVGLRIRNTLIILCRHFRICSYPSRLF